MISRREVVTAGMLGSLATGGAGQTGTLSSDAILIRDALNKVVESLDEIKASIDDSVHGNTMNHGSLGTIRGKLETWIRVQGRFPEYWDVGISVFLEIYDWHIRQKQEIKISRIAEQRMAIQWMFTQYVLRWENEPGYIGQQPYDR